MLEELLGQAVLVVANSGVAVLVGNVLKNFFPKMDGKTDIIVNVITVGLFIVGWIELEFYDVNLLFDVIPGFSYRIKEFVSVINAIVVGLVAVGLNKPIYQWFKGKLGRFFGKSFTIK